MFTKRSFYVLGVVFFLLLLIAPVDVWAQGCAMCKAVAKNSEGVGNPVKGLNRGIVYLMALPYLMVGAIAYFWFRASKKQRDKQEKNRRRVHQAMEA